MQQAEANTEVQYVTQAYLDATAGAWVMEWVERAAERLHSEKDPRERHNVVCDMIQLAKENGHLCPYNSVPPYLELVEVYDKLGSQRMRRFFKLGTKAAVLRIGRKLPKAKLVQVLTDEPQMTMARMRELA